MILGSYFRNILRRCYLVGETAIDGSDHPELGYLWLQRKNQLPVVISVFWYSGLATSITRPRICMSIFCYIHAWRSPTNYTVSYVIYIDVSMSYLILHNMFWIYDIYVLDLQLSSYTQTVTGHVPVISTSVALRPGGCRRRVDVARCNWLESTL